MIETLKQLKGDFVVLDLGSAHTESMLKGFPGLVGAVTLIEVDPLLGSGSGATASANKICLKKAVAGTRGKRLFKQRQFPDCSSFLDANRKLVEAYGLQKHFVEVSRVELECETISELLGRHGITRVDFFKTDLEGVDFEVLSSAPALVKQALCLQCELRFQPFFEGEPAFHEVTGYLYNHGHEIVSLRTATWKYNTSNRNLQRDGRTVWADAIFFLSPEKVRERFGASAWKAFAKQIILARVLCLDNFAEHLYEEASSQFPDAICRELGDFVQPPFSLARLLVAGLKRLPLGWGVLEVGRRLSRYGYKTTALYKEPILGVPDLL
jgi:hypothetical protein